MTETPIFVEYSVTGPCPLAVRDYGGSGSPILLMHGSGRNLADLAPIASRLVADHRVVAMDLRNHGHSDDGAWDWDAVLDDVDRVSAATGLVSPALVGHSLGGMIGALYSARGGQCSSVVNIDGFGLGPIDQYLGIPPDEVRQFHRAVERAALSSRPAPLDLPADPAARAAVLRQARLRVAPGARVPEELEVNTFDRSLRRLPDRRYAVRPGPEAVDAMNRAISAIDWFATFRQVTVPFLIYQCVVRIFPRWGADIPQRDRLMAAGERGRDRELDRLARDRPNVLVRKLNTDHYPMLTMPDTVAGQIHDLVTETSRRSANGL